MADFFDRSLGIGYLGGTLSLLTLLFASLLTWRLVMGSVAVESITTRKAELFYWVTIMFSQTLGTALGDWTADSAGLGYTGAASVFGGLLLLLSVAYYRTKMSHTFLFWAAFVLTRPLGAALGDFLDKPVAHGGLAVSRFTASFVLLAFIAVCLLIFPQRASRTQH
ncbi:hypothetical protein GCM10008957_44210 [Deinococcus ruber]|uniref:Uncharacterized protein n=1 Tax=Deinococcus ruber TaxID=1848197 RepID=A0A918FCW3_9DEIO|nr:hypothetical protein GCM10008957_44210 [Deinococcus ruber]